MTDRGEVLVRLASSAIAEAVGVRGAVGGGSAGGDGAASDPDWLAAPGATFVTLTRDGALRGCIGTLEAWRPLGADVRANARAAALQDPRFPPLTAEEYPALAVEVSVLSPARPLTFVDEADAAAQLRPGVDGVILAADGHRGTYLPQVWEQIGDPAAFLRSLKRKAGLAASWWGPAARLAVYSVEKYPKEGS